LIFIIIDVNIALTITPNGIVMNKSENIKSEMDDNDNETSKHSHRDELEKNINTAITISTPGEYPKFIAEYIERITKELSRISKESIQYIDTLHIEEMNKLIITYILFIEKIANLNFAQLSPQEKLSISNEISSIRVNLYGKSSHFINMAEIIKDDSASKKIDANLAKTEKILATAKQLSTNQLTKKQSKFFQDEADKHSIQSNQWKIYSIGLLVLTCTLAVAGIAMAFCPSLHPKDTYQLIQIVTGKVILIAISIYALGVCIKNYQAHKHNEILNSHRENALSAASALIDLIEEPNQKDAVLLQVANVVFSIQDTGYTKPTSSEVDVMKSVVDLLAKQVAKDK